MPRNGASWLRSCTRRLEPSGPTRTASTITTRPSGAKSTRANCGSPGSPGNGVVVLAVAVEPLLTWSELKCKERTDSLCQSRKLEDLGARQHQHLVLRRRRLTQLAEMLPQVDRGSRQTPTAHKRKLDGEVSPQRTSLAASRRTCHSSQPLQAHLSRWIAKKRLLASRWKTMQTSDLWVRCPCPCTLYPWRNRWSCPVICNSSLACQVASWNGQRPRPVRDLDRLVIGQFRSCKTLTRTLHILARTGSQ